MTSTELTTLISCGTAVGGILVGSGIAWGVMKHTLSALTQSVDKLKSAFITHETDREIHIDPKRDAKAAQDFKEFIGSHFGELKEKIGALDKRCEERGTTCAGHFLRIENRVSAATGKTNGEAP